MTTTATPTKQATDADTMKASIAQGTGVWTQTLTTGTLPDEQGIDLLATLLENNHNFRDLAIVVTLNGDNNPPQYDAHSKDMARYMTKSLDRAFNSPTRPNQTRIIRAIDTLITIREHTTDKWAQGEADTAIMYLHWLNGAFDQALAIAETLDPTNTQLNLGQIVSQAITHGINPEWTRRC